MLLLSLVLIPLLGIFLIFTYSSYDLHENTKVLKILGLTVTIVDLIISLIIRNSLILTKAEAIFFSNITY